VGARDRCGWAGWGKGLPPAASLPVLKTSCAAPACRLHVSFSAHIQIPGGAFDFFFLGGPFDKPKETDQLARLGEMALAWTGQLGLSPSGANPGTGV
jgi:hypothetical protein